MKDIAVRAWTPFTILSIAALCVPLAVLFYLLASPGVDRELYIQIGSVDYRTTHLWLVGVAAALSAAIALATALTAPSIRETRVILLVCAFMTISLVFVAHALTTPGLDAPEEHSMAMHASASLSLLGGAVFAALSASTMPLRLRYRLKRYGAPAALALAAVLTGYVLLAVAKPGMFAGWPGPEGDEPFGEWPVRSQVFAVLVALPVLALLAFAARGYLQAWRLARQPSQWAMVLSMALLMEAEIGTAFAGPWRLSWWAYHVLLVLSFAVLLGGLVYERRRSSTVALFSQALFMRDELRRIRMGYPDAVSTLMISLEEKDAYTRGHTGRVAEYAYAIGAEMGLDQRQLHQLALMGEVHDIGKIGVPESILVKSGTLTAEEFAQIKTHTVRGWAICREVPQLEEAIMGVRHHHERLDGRGYPDHLSGDQIPLQVRCLTVADVFDALTTERSYRNAMPYTDAVAVLRQDTGSAFDARCIEALSALVARGALAHGPETHTRGL